MRVELSALAQWTPVALSVDAGGGVQVDWGDFRGFRFAEPFFGQTVERWAGGDPAPLVRTGADALEVLDEAPSLDPAGLIFHLSRCGSTLCARLLGALGGVAMLSEPGPVNDLLMAEIAGALDRARAARLLRLLVRALGRRRFGDERHLVLKLSSWNVHRIALFRDAFPDAPVVWLERDPEAVLRSLAADPPAWAASLRRAPALAQAILGVPADSSDARNLARAVAQSLSTIAGEHTASVLRIDYRELPDAAWTKVAPFFGIPVPDDALPRLRDIARYDAKSLAPKLYVPARA
jgi:hypothetical protein